MRQFRLEDVVEDINELHSSTWVEMCAASNPPVTTLHYTAYMDIYRLRKHFLALSNEKLKNVLGFKMQHPHFNHETIKDMIDKLKAENTWPNVDPSSAPPPPPSL